MTDQQPHAELLRQIDVKLRELGLSERKACINAGLKVDAIRNIRRGREPRWGTVDTLRTFFNLRSSGVTE